MTGPTRDVFMLELEKRGLLDPNEDGKLDEYARISTNPLTWGSALVGPDGVKQFFAPSMRLNRPNFTGLRSLFAATQGLANDASGYTYSEAIALESHFDAIQIGIANDRTTGTITCGPVKVSTPAVYGDGNNSAGTWANVTFSGSPTVVLPNATDAADPTVTFSDWIPISSVARTDIAGGFPLLFVRSLMPASTTTFPVAFTGVTSTAWATKSDGRIWGSHRQIGDQVSTPSGFNVVTETSAHIVYAVRFRSRGKVVTVAGFGDSNMAGSNAGGATLYGDGFLTRAGAALSSATRPVSIGNFGWGGQTSAQFIKRAERLIPLIQPDIAVYTGFTPNDGTPSAASNNLARQNVARFIAVCQANNVVPVLVNGLPSSGSGYTSPQDAFRKTYNAELAAYPGTLVVDVSTAVGDGAAPENFRAGLSSDQVHGNDSANTLASVPLATAVASVFGV